MTEITEFFLCDSCGRAVRSVFEDAPPHDDAPIEAYVSGHAEGCRNRGGWY